MKKTVLASLKLPDTPGVYFFLGAKKQILYIGKATSLKNRVKSYFSNDIIEKRSELIEKMVDDAKTVEFTETDSVLEALILETNLIRTHKPLYNTRSKDDKSYNHLVITKEDFPRVLVVRGKDLSDKFSSNELAYEFGPFPNGQLFKEALKIVRKLFQFYDTAVPIGSEKGRLTRGKIDFNRQIGLYPNKQTKVEYAKTIRHLKLFFQGKKKQLINELQKEMQRLAEQEKFEQANLVKKRIFALTHIQDIALLKNDNRIYRDGKKMRIEAYDVAHFDSKDMVGVMTVVENSEINKNEYRKFKIHGFEKANDPGALSEILNRRLKHTEWPLPQLIVADGSTAQKSALEKVLKNNHLVIPVVGVVKNEKHQPTRLIGQKEMIERNKLEILLANAESHRFAIGFHRQKSRKSLLE